METKQLFDEMERTIRTAEVVVMRHVKGFPVYHQDILSPYLMVYICHSGTARALYDMREICFASNEVAVVLPNHIIHPLESSPDYDVSIIVHSTAFHSKLTQHRLSHDYSKFHDIPACTINEDNMSRITKVLDLIDIISRTPISQYPKRHEMLIMQTNIMAEMVDACRANIDEQYHKDSKSNQLFSHFCALVAKHYREQHEVAFYANRLNLTTRHFAVIIKNTIGLSASDYIEQYLASQAKFLLSTRPDLSVQQIADFLGYADSPSFCRFFKRRIGSTPKLFRTQQRE